MRRSMIFFDILLLALFVAMPAMAGDRQGTTYQVENQHHIQSLGGKSKRAHRGLEIAVLRSERITAVKTDKDPAEDPLPEPVLGP